MTRPPYGQRWVEVTQEEGHGAKTCLTLAGSFSHAQDFSSQHRLGILLHFEPLHVPCKN